MILVDGGKVKKQPVMDTDIVHAINRILTTEESKGQIYELGGGQVYTLKELLEFLGNNLQQRPFYIDYTYDELMRTALSPNSNFEKGAAWLLIRPDYINKQRIDNVITPKKGVKTFEDLDIMPVTAHQYIRMISNWLNEKIALETMHSRGLDEIEADHEGH